MWKARKKGAHLVHVLMCDIDERLADGKRHTCCLSSCASLRVTDFRSTCIAVGGGWRLWRVKIKQLGNLSARMVGSIVA